ncbi:MAG: AAA family ATPase [Acidobacteriota bacterium]|nr:AAA family ATPase [Acidobacteriota bacterium]
MSEPMREIPYGVADFTAIRQENMTYVDKTRFIVELEQAGRFLFFLRPRRSGKSLMVSTLASYYDRGMADRFESLFGGTWIGRSPTPEKNQHMMLAFNFSAVRPSPDLVEASFEQYTQTIFNGFLERYRESFSSAFVASVAAMNTAGDRLSALFDYCRRENLKLYILIDEYDNFTNTILTTHGRKMYHHITHGDGFFRYFFNVLKEGASMQDSGLARLFITGVTPVTMDDVTSGFNIGIQISLEPQFQAIAGFTEDETADVLTTYRIPQTLGMPTEDVLTLMRNWYGSYRFTKKAKQAVFNPDMVLYFIRAVLRYGALPDEMVDQNVRTDYGKLHYLLQIQKQLNGNFNLLKGVVEDGYVTARIATGFPVKQVAETNNFVSLLYYLGLLTIDEEDAGRGRYVLTIPNQTVATMMYGYLRDAWEANDVFRLQMITLDNQLNAMAFQGDWKPFFQTLAEAVKHQTAIRDFMDGEKVIQGFLLAYLCAFDYFIARSEHELHKGFCDLFLEPFTAGYPNIRHGYLIELKYIKRSEEMTDTLLQAMVTEAETQLAQYRQDPRLAKIGGEIEWICPVLVFHGWELVYYDT